jgi:CBS domain containing-hemolysin-like protein
MGQAVAIVLLLLANGFFVGAEFALVRARKSRLEAMTRKGDPFARVALRAVNQLARMLSACQLGITLASLGLGWVAEEALGHLLEGWLAGLPLGWEVAFRTSVASVTALVIATFFHVVIGELVPRSVALNHPETFSKWMAPPLIFFAALVRPFIWLLDSAATATLKLFGEKPVESEDPIHSPEELRMIVEQSSEEGLLQEQPAELIDAVFEFTEKKAADVMTPRTAVVALDVQAPLDAVLALADETRFSRYPVYEETVDHVIGMVLAKDLLPVAMRRPADFSLRGILRPVHVVPGSRDVEAVLADFKRRKEHLAVVLDEYGGTAGVVTMEDLLEELVGEILDETDDAAMAGTQHAATGEVVIDGTTAIGDVNERFGLAVPDDDYTTIGGYVFGALGRLPVVGDRVPVAGAVLTVRAMDGRRTSAVAVEREAPTAAAAP